MEIEQKYATIGDYYLLKCLGQGLTAKVKLALSKIDGKQYAIKIYKKTIAFEKNSESFIKEYQVMKNCIHPNLIKMFEILPQAEYFKKNGTSYKTIAIVMEYAFSGQLFEYVAQQRFSEAQSRTYFLQLLRGLQYLHSQGIAHRDLKPENLLYDENYHLKIADFGFATSLEGKDGSGLLKTKCGTEGYMAPEIILLKQNQKYEGTTVDVFAAGIILFIMYIGHPPFIKAKKSDSLYKFLCDNKHEEFWRKHNKSKQGKFSQELQDLFNSLFAEDPNQRPTISEILSHPWMQGPVLTEEQVQQEFTKRGQIVQTALEQQRLEKKALKAKKEKEQNNNYVYKGIGTFRCGEDWSNEFTGLDQIFPNLENQRNMKMYNPQIVKPNDIISLIDAEHLMRLLLSKRLDFSTNIELSDNLYKLNVHHENENGVITEFQIEFLNKEDSEICLIFKKVQGSSLDYFNFVEKVKKIIGSPQQEPLIE